MAKTGLNLPPQFGELLSTKLQIPLAGSRIVQRDRLISKLRGGKNCKVILITAPAGYGKTTLLGEWVSMLPVNIWRTAWVSLDSFDNTLLRLWSYITAAIQRVYPRLQFDSRQLLQLSYTPDDFSALTPLFNEIAQISSSICLILDDIQTITNPGVLQSISYLIEHQPSNLHLVLASRIIPPIPLSRLRIQRQLLELTAEDLAFTLPEARTYLSEVMSLNLTPEKVGLVLKATEGWIAGIQLAAISYQNQPDALPFRSETSSRQIFDYLSEEVLSQQPVEIQNFLLRTSILSELSAPLCDAMLERTDSGDLLIRIEKANLFLVSLDEDHTWNRYHTLFAEALQRRLEKTHPDDIPELHQRASKWLKDHRYHEEAVRHALAAGNLEYAAEIVDSCTMEAIRRFDQVSLMKWFSHFSDELISRRPRLGIYHAMIDFDLRRNDWMQDKLRIVETTLDQAKENHLHLKDEDLVRWQLKALQATTGFLDGKFERAIAQTIVAAQNIPMDDPYLGGFINHMLASAYEATDQLEAAVEAYEKGCQFALERDLVSEYNNSRCQIASIRRSQGKLGLAKREFERAFEYVRQHDPEMAVIDESKTFLMGIAIEQQLVEPIEEWIPGFVERFNNVENISVSQLFYESLSVCLTRYYLYKGDTGLARMYLQAAERSLLSQKHRFEHPCSEIIDARVRLWAITGEIQNDAETLRDTITRLKANDRPLAAEQAAFARIDLAQGQFESALEVLKELENASRENGRGERLLESLILEAVAHQSLHDEASGMQALDEALQLAAPEGYVRMFVEEGLPMKALLERFLELGGETDESLARLYARNLAAAFEHPRQTEPLQPAGTDLPKTTIIPRITEPLSDREMEVLAMLVENKSMKEITSALMISLNTCKTHIKSIYRKLGAHDRKRLLQYVTEMGMNSKSEEVHS
jgi:LuxR family maltose regulon positive regulatory protein